jgi:hypothetical protein
MLLLKRTSFQVKVLQKKFTLLHAHFSKIVLKYSNEVHLLRYLTPLYRPAHAGSWKLDWQVFFVCDILSNQIQERWRHCQVVPNLVCYFVTCFRMFVLIASENLNILAVYSAKRMQTLQKRHGNLFFQVCHIIKILLNVLTYNPTQHFTRF